jgi:hypothetical protein
VDWAPRHAGVVLEKILTTHETQRATFLEQAIIGGGHGSSTSQYSPHWAEGQGMTLAQAVAYALKRNEFDAGDVTSVTRSA